MDTWSNKQKQWKGGAQLSRAHEIFYWLSFDGGGGGVVWGHAGQYRFAEEESEGVWRPDNE